MSNMFKLESYITPLLMGYIDKYVALKQEDFKLSLWGGDVVLNKLDLRLDAIEHALALPVTFKSGHINALRIHVPWTTLGSQPVRITADTIECILKLRDTAPSKENKPTSPKSDTTAANKKAAAQRQLQQLQTDEEAPPPGYVQSLLNRITNNVNIVVNNLILKFAEDDIVLSINVKCVELFSANENWVRSFVELANPDLVLRRVINFHDLTVCLDRRNANGKIVTYQDPLLYRSSAKCYLHSTYDTLHSKYAATTKIQLYCEKLDLSLTDTQLPMFFRLLELCLAIYYGTLKLPEATEKPVYNDDFTNYDSDNAYINIDADHSGGDDESAQGWGSWAWSYVPQILPYEEDYDPDGEDSEYDGEKRPPKKPQPSVMVLGLYVAQVNVVCKLTEYSREHPYSSSQKLTFKPYMTLEAEGIGLEITLRGLTFFNVQCGITTANIRCQGDAIGKNYSDLDNSNKDAYFFRTMLEPENIGQLTFKSNSLFDPGGPENRCVPPEPLILDREKHIDTYSETYAIQKFGAFYFDYLYTAEETEAADNSAAQDGTNSQSSSSSSTSQSTSTTNPISHEISGMRFLIGPFHLTFSSSMYQRVQKYLHCLHQHEYEPYSSVQKEVVDENRTPPTDDDVEKLEEFIPTRSYHLTCIRPCVWLIAADLDVCDVTAKKIVHGSKYKRGRPKTPSPRHQPVNNKNCSLPVIMLRSERVDLQLSSAMYPRALVKAVSKIPVPSGTLLHNCHSHMYVKVFGCESGLSCLDSQGVFLPLQTFLLPWSGAYYCRSLLLPMYWTDLLKPVVEHTYEVPQLSIQFSKPQLLTVLHTLYSWQQTSPQPKPFTHLSVLTDLFTDDDDLVSDNTVNHPVLELSLSALEMKMCSTKALWCVTATLSSVGAVVLYDDTKTPVFYGPSDTSPIPTQTFLSPKSVGVNNLQGQHDLITLTLQLPEDADRPIAPAVCLLEVCGVISCVDPLLLAWLSYEPHLLYTTPDGYASTTVVDVSLAETTSPLINTSHGSQSGSAVTDPRDTHSTHTPHTDTQTPQTSTHTPMDSAHTRTSTDYPHMNVSTPIKHLDTASTQAGPTHNTEVTSTFAEKCAHWFPLAQIMQLQVNIQNIVFILPTKHLPFTNPSWDIAQNISQLYDCGGMPDTLLLSLPAIYINSLHHRPTPCGQDLPIIAMSQATAGSKLPWSVQFDNASIYTLNSTLHTSKPTACAILDTCSLSATLAVTTKYHPLTSDNISSLALCVHSHANLMDVNIADRQVKLAMNLVTSYQTAVTVLLHSIELQMKCYATAAKLQTTTNPNSNVSTDKLYAHQQSTGRTTIASIQNSNPDVFSVMSPQTSHAQSTIFANSSSGHWEITERVPTVSETSESYSQLTSNAMDDYDAPNVVKLSIWTQCTVARCVISLQVEGQGHASDIEVPLQDKVHQRKLCVELEDLTTSVDLQDVFSKVKLKLGSLNINHYVNDSILADAWSVGSYNGLLLSSQEGITKNTTVLSNKSWVSTTGSTELKAPLGFNPSASPQHHRADDNHTQPTPSANQSHAFLDATWTRAQTQNVQKRLGHHRRKGKPKDTVTSKRNEDSIATDQQDKKTCIATIPTSGEAPISYMNEVCVNVRPCDVIVNGEILASILSAFLDAICAKNVENPSRKLLTQKPKCHVERKQESTTNSAAFLLNYDFPLLYIDFTSFRVFVPTCNFSTNNESEKCNQSNSTMHDSTSSLADGNGLFEPDVFILQVSSLNVAPNADNPLPRVPVKPRSHVINNHFGPESDDRQYQLDMNTMSLCTGNWSDIIDHSPALCSELDTPSEVQHPAVEWNQTAESRRRETSELQLVPIAMNFDLRIVAAPPIINKLIVSPEASILSRLICGASLEVNATSDVDLYLSIRQVQLANEIVQHNIVKSINILVSPDMTSESIEPNVVTEAVPQSKVTRDPSSWLVPFDVLLTAGRITLFTYSCEHSKLIHSAHTKLGMHNLQNKQKSPSLSIKQDGRNDLDITSDSGIGSTATGATATATAVVSHPNVQDVSHNSSTCDVWKVEPLFYISFSQPHSMLVCRGSKDQKIELSCYDINLNGAKPDYSYTDQSKFLPDASDFEVHWLETRQGRLDSKTGIPPTLYTLTAKHFLSNKATVQLDIGRPVKFHLSLHRLDAILSTYQLILRKLGLDTTHTVLTETVHTSPNTVVTPSSQSSEPSFSTTPNISGPPAVFSKFFTMQLTTSQLVVVMETESCEACPAVQASINCITAKCNVKAKEEIYCEASLKDFKLKTIYSGHHKPVLGPLTCTASLTAMWREHSGSRSMPWCVAGIDAGAVRVHIGQQHLVCVQAIMKCIEQWKEENGFSSKPSRVDDGNDMTMDTSAIQEHQSMKKRTKRKRLFTEGDQSDNITHDDLRTGDFVFIMEDATECTSLPQAGHVHICSDYTVGRATLTWCYNDPRVLTSLSVTPVPLMGKLRSLDASMIDENFEVPCVLQYWDSLSQCYVDYKGFSLSEHRATLLTLPEATYDYNSTVRAAQIWRILIMYVTPSETDLLDVGEVEPLVSPQGLIASLCVSSCFVPDLVPWIQTRLFATCLYVHCYNHYDHLGRETCLELKPYNFDHTAINRSQELLICTVEEPIIKMSYLPGRYHRLNIQTCGTFGCEVIEFLNLTQSHFLSPTSCHVQIVKDFSAQNPRLTMNGFIESANLRICQSTVHTLNALATSWLQVGSYSSICPVLNYYMICNNTQQMIMLSQAGSDEAVTIQSQQVYPYSWRSHKHAQMMRISTEGLGGQWSESFNLDNLGTKVRVVECKGDKVILFIRIKQLSNVQKQVIISGRLCICSRLQEPLEVRLLTSGKTASFRESTNILQSCSGLPSYVVEQACSLRVRRHGPQQTMMWSQEVGINGAGETTAKPGEIRGGEKTNRDARLIKVPLEDKNNFTHVWCHVFTQQHQTGLINDHNIYQQTWVVLMPVFVVRNDLPCNLQLHIDTARVNSGQQIEVIGHGTQQQITMTGGDVTHHISFQLCGSSERSAPPISLSSGMLDQLPWEPLTFTDLERVAYDYSLENKSQWPYNFTYGESAASTPVHSSLSKDVAMPQNIPTSPNSQHANDMNMENMQHPNIDLQVNMSQLWAGCNTVLINVSPYWLFANNTDIHIALVVSGGKVWNIPKQQTLAPPMISASFRFSITIDGSSHVSDHIVLSEQDDQSRFLPKIDGVLYCRGHMTITVPIRNQDNVITRICYLSLSSTMHNDLRIVTVRELYQIANKTDMKLDVQCFTIPLKSDKKPLEQTTTPYNILPCQEKAKSSSCTPLTEWQIPNAIIATNMLKMKNDTKQQALDIEQNTNTEENRFPPNLLTFSSTLPSNDIGEQVHYISFRKRADTQKHTLDLLDPMLWSYPVRLKPDSTKGVRLNASILVRQCSAQCNGVCSCGYDSRCIVVSVVVSSYGVVYMTVEEEYHSTVCVHNNCAQLIYVGQTLANDTFKTAMATHEQSELITSLPCVPSFSSIHYTPPTLNTSYPSPAVGDPRIHFTAHTDLMANESTASKVPANQKTDIIEWSTGIDLYSGYDSFATIPSCGDVKIHIEHVGHTCHMFLDPVGRAEVSAREIRSRIKDGKQITTTVVQMMSVDDVKDAKCTPLTVNTDFSPTQSPVGTSVQSPMTKGAGKLVNNWQSNPPRLRIEAGFVCQNMRMIVEDSVNDHSIIQEVLSICVDTLILSYFPIGLVDRLTMRRQCDLSSIKLAVNGVQIDNQLYDTGVYDFPVVLLPTPQPPNENVIFHPSKHFKTKAIFNCPVSELVANFIGQEQSMLLLSSQLCYDASTSKTIVQTVDIAISPLSLNIEDTFVYYVLKITDSFVPTQLKSSQPKHVLGSHQLPSDITDLSSAVCQPVRLQKINVSSLSVLLSVHASLKLFISSDHSPLSFVAFTRSGLITSGSQLTRAIIMHYASGALFRAGLVVGSLELLGNPTGLVRNVAHGVHDLVSLPYKGITQGPGAFIGGVKQGMTSLLSHLSAGTLSSVTSFASSVSRNMDRLSLDSDHQARQQSVRRQQPRGITEGLKQGLTGFGFSLLGAVAGIADHPLQTIIHGPDSIKPSANVPADHMLPASVTNAANLVAPSLGDKLNVSNATGIVSGSIRTTGGVVSGFGKGLVGVVTKPIGGAAELVSQTSMGLLYGTGLSKALQRRYPVKTVHTNMANNSTLKYQQKMLLTVLDPTVLSLVNTSYTQIHSNGSIQRRSISATLVLTADVLFVVGTDEDYQLQAYPVAELDCWADSGDSNIMYIALRALTPDSSITHEVPLDTKDRVAQFVDGTTGYTARYIQQQPDNLVVPGGKKKKTRSRSKSQKTFRYAVDEKSREMFLTEMALAKDRAQGFGFVL